MGAAGKMSSVVVSSEDRVKRVPHARPPFTLAELKKAIPPHCFHRSVVRSYSYVVADVIASVVIYWAAFSLIPTLPSPTLQYTAWAGYWLAQGSVWFSLWTIAHACGHQALSDYKWLDDTVGLIIHSFLLVPYFSWRIGHRRHHLNIGTLDRDEYILPKQRSDVHPLARRIMNNPIGRSAFVALIFLLSFPCFLAFNYNGRPYPRFASHYDPLGPIFSSRERVQAFASDSAILVVLGLLSRMGLGWVFLAYLGPLLVVNAWVSLVSLLEHVHPALPRYDSSEWEWLRGTLSTVDRDYGVVFNSMFHLMVDTHVVHHLFPKIPHHHSAEATRAIRPILGDYYMFDSTPIYKAIFREVKQCFFVETDQGSRETGVFWFRSVTD